MSYIRSDREMVFWDCFEETKKSYLDGTNGYRVLAPVMDKVMNATFAETDSKYEYHFVPTKNGRNLALRSVQQLIDRF